MPDSKHEELVKKAKDAIQRVFSDKTVDLETTRESLKDLRDELDVLIDAAK
jgi:hypothetical protein